jgi:hypothetical protein
MKNRTALKLFFVPGLLFVLAACSNPFVHKPAQPDREFPEGMGAALWSVEIQTAARTLIPEVPFTKYELTFTAPGKTTVTETFTTPTGELMLEIGGWNLSVLAYDGNDPVANGSAYLTVQRGQINSVTVLLGVPGVSGAGTGTLGYNLTLPDGLLYGELLVAALDGGYANALPLTPASGSISLPDGYYVLAFSLFKAAGRAVITDLAHVYDGLTSNGVYDFSGAPFMDAPEIAVPPGGAVIFINSAADLAAIAGDIGNPEKNNGKNAYILNNDIDLSSPWTPLGGSAAPFEGYLFGDGHTIRGLDLSASGSLRHIGLFGSVRNTRIENMNVEFEDTAITLPNDNEDAMAGIIAGSGTGTAVFKDLRVSAASGGEFTLASSNGYRLHVGGLAGGFSAISIERCGFTGNIAVSGGAQKTRVGGLAGDGGTGGIRGSFMTGIISHTNTRGDADVFTGGIAGGADSLEDCYHNGNIFALSESGANKITGGICASGGDVSRSYSSGSIVSGGAGYTAGISAGSSGTVTNSAVLNLALSGGSPARIGGATATVNYALNTMVVNGFVITDGANPQNDANGLGKTTAELKQQSSYETGLGWNFTDVWEMGPAQYPYPILKWQKGQVDLPDGYGLMALPEDLVIEFTTVNDLSNYLATLPQNSALDPYAVKLDDLAISDFANAAGDPLGALFAAFEGRYVTLDLSDCGGTAVADTTNSLASNRANRTMPVSITLPAGITSIGNFAFHGCNSLTSIELPAGITSIGNYAFQSCISLASIELPASLTSTSIGNYAFRYCSALTTVSLPSATSIGADAFSNCAALTTVSLPAATSIGADAFYETGTNTLTLTLGGVAPTLGYGMFSWVGAKTVTVKVPSGATGYGTVPATYSGTDSAVNWGNGFRGGGWDGSAFTGGSVNSNITLTIQEE